MCVCGGGGGGELNLRQENGILHWIPIAQQFLVLILQWRGISLVSSYLDYYKTCSTKDVQPTLSKSLECVVSHHHIQTMPLLGELALNMTEGFS